MTDLNLVEVDSLEALVIIDNELDPISPAAPDTVQISGLLNTIAANSPDDIDDRGDARKELRMEDICCSAHGLSILIVRAPSPSLSLLPDTPLYIHTNAKQTATKGDTRHSILFDAGPEPDAWERNVSRLRPDLAAVEMVQLSHWHRDHSGMQLRSLRRTRR
jgi:7,8-dihydropterin-6-yl-methyl-4-(beta-D-ribofuranosyl)aminobenzene 5'-phosphate synthase